jgi:hypothetical protein
MSHQLLLRDEPLLLDYRPGDAGVTLTRGSVARSRNSSGAFVDNSSGVLRDDHWVKDNVSGALVRTTLTEGQRTQLYVQSADFNTTWVGINTDFSAASSSSVISGKTAWKATANAALGNTRIRQDAGLWDGAAHAFSAIIEQGNTDGFQIVMLGGATTSTTINQVKYKWSTGVLTQTGGSGVFHAELLAPGIVKITVVGTSASGTRRVDIYGVADDATAVGSYQIFHEAQLEPGADSSSPIITAASSLIRSADTASIPLTFQPDQDLTAYFDWYDLGGLQSLGAVNIALGGGFGASNRICVKTHPSSVNAYRLELGGNFNIGLSAVYGNRVRVRITRESLPTPLWHFYASVDGGAEAGPMEAAALTASFTTWTTNACYIGNESGLSQTQQGLRAIMVAKGIQDLAFFAKRIP